MKIQDLIKTLALKSNAVQILSGGNLDIDMNVATYGDTYRKLSENLAGQAIIIVDKSETQSFSVEVKMFEKTFEFYTLDEQDWMVNV